jgi:predicted Holliday junction resolvase-like endonuclease
MEFLILLVLIAFLVVEGVNNKRIYELRKRMEKPEVKLSNEEKRKMEAIKTSFNNLMEYDEQTAMKRK